MRTQAIDKKQRKHEMLLTFMAAAHAGKPKQQQVQQRKRPAPVNVRSMILLLLGTV